MKTKLPLFQILFIYFLLCFCTKAHTNQKILLAPEIGEVSGFSIPFEPKYQLMAPDNRQLGFNLEFPGINKTVPIYINMKSNGFWINNSTRSSWSFNFDCSASPTCKNQGPSEHAWMERRKRAKRKGFYLEGILVKEQVGFEGGLTLPNTDILIANYGDNVHSRFYLETYFKGVLGLSFRRSCSEAPNFYDFLQKEGLVEASIFSIYLNASDHGELIFGGYDPKRAGSEFHYVKFRDGEEVPGFYLPLKTIGFDNEKFDVAEEFVIVIDFDSEDIRVPEWVIRKIDSAEWKDTCGLPPILEDIVIEFEGVTLRIPSDVYTNPASFKQPIGQNGKISRNIDCTFLKQIERAGPEMMKIVLGRQFLKYFYTVFDLEEKTVGFSTMSGFVPNSPVFEKTGDSLSSSKLREKQIKTLVALIIIGILVSLIRRVQKSRNNPSIKL